MEYVSRMQLAGAKPQRGMERVADAYDSGSNGITAVPETFKLGGGKTAKGTLYLAWNYDGPKSGSGGIIIGDCAFYPSIGKQR